MPADSVLPEIWRDAVRAGDGSSSTDFRPFLTSELLSAQAHLWLERGISCGPSEPPCIPPSIRATIPRRMGTKGNPDFSSAQPRPHVHFMSTGPSRPAGCSQLVGHGAALAGGPVDRDHGDHTSAASVPSRLRISW